MPDEQIVQLIITSGDPSHFEEIYERYALKVYQKCLSFTKAEDEAKDLAHDLFVKIYLSLNKFNERSKFSTWLYAITYNYCEDHQAKKKKQRTLAQELTMDIDIADSEELEDRLLLELNIQTLHALLEKLNPSEKALLLMKYQDDLSIKEIAEMLGAGESAVKMKLKRSKDKLRNLYKKHER